MNFLTTSALATLLLTSLALFPANASAIPTSKTSVHKVKTPGYLELKTCPASSNRVDVHGFKVTPFPISSKSDLEVSISGHFKERITAGAKLEILAKVWFISIPVTLDICEELELDSRNPNCPLDPGVHTLHLNIPKSYLYPMNIDVEVKGRHGKRELFCYNTKMSVKG